MTQVERPRVAAIGLSDTQLESISALCGDLRTEDSLPAYLSRYDWSETDAIIVSKYMGHTRFDPSVNLVCIGVGRFAWTDRYEQRQQDGQVLHLSHEANTTRVNTERELSVSEACPSTYGALAAELRSQLTSQDNPPTVVETSRISTTPLLETTSGKAVALRLDLPVRAKTDSEDNQHPISLFLPEQANLSSWFRAFLSDVHQVDPSRVPNEPPRLGRPSDWYTPTEQAIANKINDATLNIRRLTDEREHLLAQLAAEDKKANSGVRRAVWAHGQELTTAVSEILADLGFEVRDMDAGLEPNEQKYEDLRLTLPHRPDWEAIVEVKGYTKGTRTNDALQLRKHREHYIVDKGRPPDFTIWLANPFRQIDPSSRPAPVRNVGEAAENIGAVHVLATDLYRLWVLVQTGDLIANDVVQDLVDASTGLWSPKALGDKA